MQWQLNAQVYGLGDKAELLVAVRQPEGPEGPTTVTLTSDLASPAVLHWGVKRGRKRSEWLRPPDEVCLPPAATGSPALGFRATPNFAEKSSMRCGAAALSGCSLICK